MPLQRSQQNHSGLPASNSFQFVFIAKAQLLIFHISSAALATGFVPLVEELELTLDGMEQQGRWILHKWEREKISPYK